MGVTHMNLGILMSLFNNLYFRDTLSIWAEFVPQARMHVCLGGRAVKQPCASACELRASRLLAAGSSLARRSFSSTGCLATCPSSSSSSESARAPQECTLPAAPPRPRSAHGGALALRRGPARCFAARVRAGRWVTGSTADLYHVLITMFLNPGTVDEQAYLFPYQDTVQVSAGTGLPCPASRPSGGGRQHVSRVGSAHATALVRTPRHCSQNGKHAPPPAGLQSHEARAGAHRTTSRCVRAAAPQTVLLLAALVAVPCMLLPKPLILNARYKASQVRCGRGAHTLGWASSGRGTLPATSVRGWAAKIDGGRERGHELELRKRRACGRAFLRSPSRAGGAQRGVLCGGGRGRRDARPRARRRRRRPRRPRAWRVRLWRGVLCRWAREFATLMLLHQCSPPPQGWAV